MLKTYLKRIFEIASRGDDREESYYSTLEHLLEEYANSTGKPHIKLTTLPKKTEAGNPDFRVWDGEQHIVGYVEAKAPTIKDLGEAEDSDQLRRYLHTFPNIILANFFEFRLYRNGALIDSVQIARPFIIHKLRTIPPAENEAEFFALLDKFLSFSLPKVYEVKKLAVEEFVSSYGEGAKANFIRDHILKNFYAFELMMAPYAVGHLKMSFLLEELGYNLQKDDRFKLYLTNTLEMEELAQSELPGMVSLSEESHLAGRVKKETPILVIMGNPPYSGISANRGRWIDESHKICRVP